MRTKFVVGNWKMNLSMASAAGLVDTFMKAVEKRTDVDIAVCPSFILIPRMREILKDTHVQVGAQDVFWMEHGAFTGQVSAPMLYDHCVSCCILGHSEVRGRFGKLDIAESTVPYFAETDHTINLKLRALLYHSINPILCVGETADERAAGKTDAIIRKQLLGALEGIEPAELYFMSVAYEPVWAIGTGNTCDAAEAERVCAMIRATLGEILDPNVAEEVRILYGGSVKASNAKELFSQPNIDGGLVGGASLDPAEFAKIVASA